MRSLFERRLATGTPRTAVAVRTVVAVAAALGVGVLLFLPFGVNPLDGYRALFTDAFFTVKGLGFTLAKTAPLILAGTATVLAWRSGFAYLGFEGCLLVGATATTAIALLARPGLPLDGWGRPALWLLCALGAFLAGGLWAGLVGFLRTRFGGNEVLLSLMTNYLAVLLLQYLVSGPLRAPGDLPQSPRLPEVAWLPYLAPGMRGHGGILLALAGAWGVSHLLRRLRLGYEFLAMGLNPRAARYSGIAVERRILLAAFLCGGLAALGGFCDLLGVHHRLMDGLSEGTGFIGMVVALLGKLTPTGVTLASFLYAGMTVGADSLQRHSGVPSSVAVIVQCLIVLFILAGDLLDRYRVAWPWRRRPASG